MFDTGHQAYVHKMVTGPAGGLRPPAPGRAGCPATRRRAESEHDWVENSHASTALSYADGMAKAFACPGRARPHVVAVVGDGALTGGMAWEALNNIAAAGPAAGDRRQRQRRSYAPTIGGSGAAPGHAAHDPGYERRARLGEGRPGPHTPVVGAPLYEALHGVKKGVKDVVAPQGMFEDLGLKYLGPVDGHDIAAVEHALRAAKRFGGPVIVHCDHARRGRGYDPPSTTRRTGSTASGSSTPRPAAGQQRRTTTWTAASPTRWCGSRPERPDVVAITAAMLSRPAWTPSPPPPGPLLRRRHRRAARRDLGRGLAIAGLHPVVAVYATFLNRAFDQVLMDVALHRGVTIVLDRAGVTGDDGASHNGMWDMSILQVVPGLRLAAPRDAARCASSSRRPSPWTTRRPSCVSRRARGRRLRRRSSGIGEHRRAGPFGSRTCSWSPSGVMAALGVEVAERLADQGIGVTVVDPRWVLPVDPALLQLAARHRFVLTVEDNGRVGGVGSRIAQAMRDAGVRTPLRDAGIPQDFLDQGKRGEILAEIGLSAQNLARLAVEEIAGLEPSSTASLTQS
jgi:1-deoxy-D-xylulose-5-phosphate synthase